MYFRILYQDPYLVAIEKPAGYHVHPPEDSTHRISPLTNCLHLLGKQLNTYLYPVHRLDRATSGVLLFALQSETARELCQLFQNQKIKKTYITVVRGWTPEAATIEHPLRSENDPDQRLESVTAYERIAKMEIPFPNGRFSSSRYSLLHIEPHTGRRHQIRRHCQHISHPLIGDTIYGNGEHNRLFREKLEINGLLLKAYSVEMIHPQTGTPLRITSRWNGMWHQLFDLFGVCPYV